jgi:hypothetical protein
MDVMEIEAELYIEAQFAKFERDYEGDRIEDENVTEAPLPAPSPPEVPNAP